MSKSKKIKSAPPSPKITRLDFSATHVNGLQLPTDMFYVGLANKLCSIVHKFLSSNAVFTSEVSKRMAITLACYVEDLVARSGVWAAFTSLYKKKYKRRFPFYNVREQSFIFPYDDETPSFHAVLFLLWYVGNDAKPEIMLNPNNPGLRMLAITLMPDLNKAYDEAPETVARPIIMPGGEDRCALFYQIRGLCEWLSSRCYLTRIVDEAKAAGGLKDFLGQLDLAGGDFDDDAQAYAARVFLSMNTRIGPLAIPAYEWLAEIIGLYHEPEEEQFLPLLNALKSLPYDFYRYASMGERELVIMNSRNKKFVLSADTMPLGVFPPEVAPGKSTLISLVFLDGVWLMNGIALQALPEQVYKEHRDNLRKSRKQGKESYQFLMKAFGNQRMGVCGSYDDYLKLVYGGDVPAAAGDSDLADAIRKAGNVLYFLNSDGNVSMLPGWASYVKIDGNPFYDAGKASKGGLAIILNHSLTTPELREYVIKHKLIPDAALNSMISPEIGRQLFQQNIRFLNDYSSRDTTTVMERR